MLTVRRKIFGHLGMIMMESGRSLKGIIRIISRVDFGEDDNRHGYWRAHQGKQEGIWKYWHANGNLGEGGEFHQGRKDKICRSWNREGHLTSQAEYNSGKILMREEKVKPYHHSRVY